MTPESRTQLAPTALEEMVMCGGSWILLGLSQPGWFHFRAMSIAEGAKLKPLYDCIAPALPSKLLKVNLGLEVS